MKAKRGPGRFFAEHKSLLAGFLLAISVFRPGKIAALSPAPIYLSIQIAGSNEVTIGWWGSTDTIYNLQRTSDVASGRWENSGGRLYSGGESMIYVTNQVDLTSQFYRVTQVDSVVKLDESSNGTTVTLAQGNVLELTLLQNSSTGFSWAILPDENPIVRVIGEPQFTPGSAVGSPGKVTFQFETAGKGTGKLNLAYRRSFDPDNPAQTYTLDITVN